MRNQYPVSTYDFNDKILSAYEHLVYLLGLDTTDGLNVTGLYDQIDASGLAYMTNISGIPHIGTNESKYTVGLNDDFSSEQIVLYQRAEYLYKKLLGVF